MSETLSGCRGPAAKGGVARLDGGFPTFIFTRYVYT